MKFTSLAIASLIGLAQSVKIARELPAAPAYQAENYDEYSSTEHADFEKAVEKAKVDTMLYQQEHKAELERQEYDRLSKEYEERQSKKMQEEREQVLAKGKVMVDGLLHTGDGKVYFPDGHEVAGANQ